MGVEATQGRPASRSKALISPKGVAKDAWDAWRCGRGWGASTEGRRPRRLAELIAFARPHSPLYRELYRDLPDYVDDIRQIPPVDKSVLMENFDRWVTDRALAREGLEVFISDPSRAGKLYKGRYAVWISSGVSGTPGIFVHDRESLKVYAALALVRGVIS